MLINVNILTRGFSDTITVRQNEIIFDIEFLLEIPSKIFFIKEIFNDIEYTLNIENNIEYLTNIEHELLIDKKVYENDL